MRKKIEKLVKKLLPKGTEFSVKYPPKEEYGDYSVVLRQALAEKVKQKLEKKMPGFLEKVMFIPPGFLNFYIKKEYFKKEVATILKQGEKFGKVKVGKRKKTNIEFISANPTGPLHIGNGRGAFFGDVLANLLSFSGFKVDREYYVNDAKNSNQIVELGRTANGEGDTYLTDELHLKIKNQNSKIKNIIQKFKNKETIYSESGYLLANEILKDIQKFASEKLKIKFDKWFSEQKDLIEKSKTEKILKYLKKKKLTYKKDGATWLRTSKLGDTQDRVIIRKTGQPTYFLSDIAYHKDKIKRGYKKIIDIWGADHQAQVKSIKAAMNILGYKGEFEVLISQIVNLKGGEKMSKRAGNVVYLEDLVEEVGLDVARYFYISKSLSSQMEFDLELAKEQSEKNPVYYIQYALVRAKSIIKKSKKARLKVAPKNLELLNHKSELKLAKELLKFPEIIEDIANDYQLQRLTEYARNIATIFNQFYRDCKVLTNSHRIKSNKTRIFENDSKSLDDNSRNPMEARLSLVFATKIVLSNLLSLMGISYPEKM